MVAAIKVTCPFDVETLKHIQQNMGSRRTYIVYRQSLRALDYPLSYSLSFALRLSRYQDTMRLVTAQFGALLTAPFASGFPFVHRSDISSYSSSDAVVFNATTSNATFGLTHYTGVTDRDGDFKAVDDYTLRAWESSPVHTDIAINEDDIRAAMLCLEVKFCNRPRRQFRPRHIAACSM